MEINKNGEVRGGNVVKEASPVDLDPYAKLGAAVLKRACQEAQEGDIGAAEFMLGDLAAWFFELLELDHKEVERVVSDWMEKIAGRIVIRIFVEV
jgi:hypothetical protein